MISGLPRPAIAGSAKLAPRLASFCISGSGLISLLSGMKPETIAPGGTATGNGRAAIASARSGVVRRQRIAARACAATRSSALASSIGG